MISRRIFTRQVLLLSLLFALLALGSILLVNQIESRNFQNDLFSSMDLTLAAVNPDRIKNQAKNPSDAENADYKRLKEQALKIGVLFQAKGVDSIYAMTRQDNKVSFLFDSLPTNHKRYSPPGVEYVKAPPELVGVFTSGQAALVGPYTDEYGTFLSYFKPVRIFDTNELVGVMGVDINYSLYLQKVFQSSLLAVAVVSLFYIFSLFLLFYFRGRSVARKKIDDSKKITENMINSLPDFFYVFNETNQLIIWNQSLLDTFGYQALEMANIKYQNLFRQSDLKRVGQSIAEVHRSGFSSLEIDMVTKTKKIIPSEINNSLLKDPSGKVIGIVGSGRDITARRQREEELINQRRNLEKINELMVGRELKMAELKQEIVRLKN